MQLYYEFKNNFIFISNPLVKLLIYFIFILSALVFNNPLYYTIIFTMEILFALFSKTLIKSLKFIKYSWIIGFFLLIFNILLNKSGLTIIFKLDFYLNPINQSFYIGTILLSLETLIFTLISIFQLVIIMFAFALINITINPDELMQSFLKLKLPYVMSLLLILSIRFFPLLLSDLNTISEVQKTRGYEIEKGSFLLKIKRRMVLLLPLLANSLERSIQVSEAMEARAFGINKNRIFYKEIKFEFLDYIMLLCIFFIILFSSFLTLNSFGVLIIYPKFSGITIKSLDLINLGIMSSVIFLFLPLLYLNRIKKSKSVRNLDD